MTPPTKSKLYFSAHPKVSGVSWQRRSVPIPPLSGDPIPGARDASLEKKDAMLTLEEVKKDAAIIGIESG